LKKASMELGGKNPQLIFPDADMDAALDAAAFGAYFNAGECCNAGSRILLHKQIADEFLAGLSERAKTVKVGDPLDPETRVGAIISADHLGKIERHIMAAEQGGAKVRSGGAKLESSGFFMSPTIVENVTSSMEIASAEVFGPVVVALTFDDLEEAVGLANATDYGLSASVWSRDIDTAVGVGRGVRAGTIWVNTYMDGMPELPFGGYRQSGRTRAKCCQRLHRGKNVSHPYRSSDQLVAPSRGLRQSNRGSHLTSETGSRTVSGGGSLEERHL
jgi:betaine-aldehyde dehydrogenase